MSRIRYLARRDIDDIVGALSSLFPDGTPFSVAGARGESALAQPRWPHYRTAQAKAAALQFSLNKNHAFVDGNKRVAVTAMEWFLIRNGFALHASNDEVVAFALAVAANELSREDSEVWIARRTSRATWSDARRARWQREARASSTGSAR